MFDVVDMSIEPKTEYMFFSFADAHSGDNLGCCIIKSSDPDEAKEVCDNLGLTPNGCLDIRAYPLTEIEFLQQDMELNRLYSRDEMILQKGFRSTRMINKD